MMDSEFIAALYYYSRHGVSITSDKQKNGAEQNQQNKKNSILGFKRSARRLALGIIASGSQGRA